MKLWILEALEFIEGAVSGIPSDNVRHPSIDVEEPSFVVCAFCNYCMVFTIVFFKNSSFSQFVVLLWFSLLEHLLFCDSTSSNNIYIHYIHVCNDYVNIKYHFCASL